KKIQQIEHGMEVEVLEVIRGEESRSTITIWGDPGHLCRVYTSSFEIGATVIFALSKIETPPNPDFFSPLEKVDDYIISVCGLHYTKCNDPVNPYTQEVEDLAECLGFDPCNCGQPKLNVYPNPTIGPLAIKLPAAVVDVSPKQVNVYDIRGALVRNLQFLTDGEERTLNLDLGGLHPGIYFLEYRSPLLCGSAKAERILLR
ncbi:MAG: T9SS type A sorting domain-containing protein, partial [Bacteroidota bacterium]